MILSTILKIMLIGSSHMMPSLGREKRWSLPKLKEGLKKLSLVTAALWSIQVEQLECPKVLCFHMITTHGLKNPLSYIVKVPWHSRAEVWVTYLSRMQQDSSPISCRQWSKECMFTLLTIKLCRVHFLKLYYKFVQPISFQCLEFGRKYMIRCNSRLWIKDGSRTRYVSID